MNVLHCTRSAAFSGLWLVLACGTDPAGPAQPLPSNGGTSGSAGAAPQPTAGTAPSNTGGTVAGTGGAASGSGGMPATMAGSGGSSTATGGGSGAGGSGGSGGSAGAGGASDGWVKIFNGQDLTGWSSLIHKSAYKADPYNTFRADPTNKVIRVTYEDYPDGDFDGRCGVLYYDKLLTNYRVRVTYRFLEPQAKNPVSWGKNNTGLMIFGIDPAKVTGDPEFPPLIEIQLLGAGSTGGSTNINLCVPGGMTMTKANGGCGNNGTGKPQPPAGDWVTVEADVKVNGDTKVYQYPDKTTPLLTMSGPMYQGKAVTGGYLSLQSESQPLEYKDIELMELP